jgi:DNA-binding CsgD family transcriptional regulator
MATSGDEDPGEFVLDAAALLALAEGERVVLRGTRAGRDLVITIEATERGAPPGFAALTPREHEVTGLVLRGLPTKLVARRLGISPWTVTTHLRSIYDKLGVASRAELAAIALRDARAAS